ncbi:hypothetical protein E8E14_013363 [Neopestalotiopsis sp. 37M]|nr:hypothetical protein E8E14_013363 [Neopestalotiopsis sp. 37M]
MADPIGVVGTAVGVVSFGLQLYSAVATYVDALDGRRDDLASTRAKLDSLRDSLTTIQSALPSSPSTGTSTIPPIVTECKAELDQLEVLLQDLVGSNASGNKLKERIRTLKFPFRRDSLMKLEDRLHKTNSVFQTALSVLNLNKSIDNERRFTNVETTTAQIPAINTNVVQISTDVQNLRVDIGNMSTNVNSTISTMNSNNNEALSRLDFSVTQLTATAGQNLPQISNSIASIEQRMQSLSALEERPRSLSLLEQILGIQDAPVQATPQLALQRLLAKPSQSREIYDSLSHSINQETSVGALSDMIVELVQAGLPADDYDERGRTPVTEVALFEHLFLTKGLLPVLYKAAPDPVRLSNEVFDCGPLSAAITAQKDEEQIHDLINANNIFEVNSFGQTPVHLAAGTGNAKVLLALLRAEGTRDIVHARDTSGQDAITYAAFNSRVSCYNGSNPVFCSKCCCTSTLDVLLSADGFFDDYLHDLRGCQYFPNYTQAASHSWKLRFFTEIKLRRDELRQLALSYLEVGDIHRYKLDGDSVLDHHGAEVIECLTEMGIEVPARFQNSFLDSRQGASIYRLLSHHNKHDAQLLLDLGFRDLDEPDELGFTPLMTIPPYSSDDAELMLWFVEHGADLARIIPDTGLNNKHGCSTVAHLMARKWVGSVYRSATHAMSNIAPVSTVDGCKCYCSETGCTPASILFSYFAKGYPFRDWHQQQKIINVVSRLAEFLEDNDIDMTIHRHACLSALRMLTFEALEIRHTCGCRCLGMYWTSDDLLSSEDVEDIWEEDAHLIDRLNELQTQFETSFDESGMSFNAFLVKLWIPRMEIVLQELDQVELSEAERGDAELLGVEWDSCEVQYSPQQGSQDYDDLDLHPPMNLQEYLRAIRKIAEE